jgi:hypothetical protein
MAGISFGLASAPFYSAIQRAVPSHLHGRVFGVQSTLSGIILPTGRTITGGALEYFNARSIFLFMGVLYLINAFLSNLLTKDQSSKIFKNLQKKEGNSRN